MTPTMTALPDFLDFSRAPQTKAATPIRTHSRSPPSIVAGAGSSPHAMSGGQTPVALSGSLEGRGPEASRPGSVSTGSPSPSHSHSHLQSPFAAHHPHLHQQQHFAPAYFAANGVSSVELGVGGVGVSGPSSASSTGFSSPGPFDYVSVSPQLSASYGFYPAFGMPPAQSSQPFDGPQTLQWTESITAPPPATLPQHMVAAPNRPVQTHGNRDLTSANFILSGGAAYGPAGEKLGKPSGACTRCKKLKMKCELRSGEEKCQRCKGGDHDCVPARRRPRRPRTLPGGSAPLNEGQNMSGPTQRRERLHSVAHPYAPGPQYPTHQHQQHQHQPQMGPQGQPLTWAEPIYATQQNQYNQQQQWAQQQPGYGGAGGYDGAGPGATRRRASRSPSSHSHSRSYSHSHSRSHSRSRSPNGTEEIDAERDCPIRIIADMAAPDDGAEEIEGDDGDVDDKTGILPEGDAEKNGNRDAGGEGKEGGKEKGSFFGSGQRETKGQHLSQIQLPSFDHFAHGTSRPAPRNSNSNGSRHAPHRDSNASQARSPGHRDSNASERDRDHGPDKGGTRRMSGVETGTADGEQESAGPDLGSGRIAEWDEDRATLVPGLIDEKEERALFQLFFDRININAALLDPRLHTYEYVRKKSLFLLTVMTAIASRYASSMGINLKKGNIYPDAMARARLVAAIAFVAHGKSVESCQAYILLTLYGNPIRAGEEDKAWQFSGLAIRMATDLNLHRLPAMPRDLQVELENISRANWATSSSKRPSIQSPISPGSALTSPTHTHADPPLSATSTMAPTSASPSLAPSTAPASAMSPASTAGTGATSGSGQPVLVPGPANDIEQRVREHMNRARVWLVCFNLDRSLSTQFGRPNTVLVNFPGARTWYLSAGENGRWNDPYDLPSCAFAEVMILMTAFQKRVFREDAASSGLAVRGPDLESLTLETSAQLRELDDYWRPKLEGHMTDYPGCTYRTRLWPFCIDYSRLVMFSFGFQEAFTTGEIQSTDNVWFRECYGAAKKIVEVVAKDLPTEPYYKTSFQSHYVYPTFAAAFLLKLLRPAFNSFIGPEFRETVISLIRDVIATFHAAAADEGHAPKHYARFLRNHLNRLPKSGSGGEKRGRKSTTASDRERTAPRGSLDEKEMEIDVPAQVSPQHQSMHPSQQPMQHHQHSSSSQHPYDSSGGSQSAPLYGDSRSMSDSPTVSMHGPFFPGPSNAPLVDSPPTQWPQASHQQTLSFVPPTHSLIQDTWPGQGNSGSFGVNISGWNGYDWPSAVPGGISVGSMGTGGAHGGMAGTPGVNTGMYPQYFHHDLTNQVWWENSWLMPGFGDVGSSFGLPGTGSGQAQSHQVQNGLDMQTPIPLNGHPMQQQQMNGYGNTYSQ